MSAERKRESLSKLGTRTRRGPRNNVDGPAPYEIKARLTLRGDGTYRLCRPACGEGRFGLERRERGEDEITFRGGPMAVFMVHADPWRRDYPAAMAYAQKSAYGTTPVLYSGMGLISIPVSEAGSFAGGCFLFMACSKRQPAA
jgi:hypothetical protein